MGNEVADKYAEQIKNQDNINIQVQYSKAEIKNTTETKNKGIWKYLWGNKSTGRHLHRIQKNVGWQQEDAIVSGMRNGHTGLNSSLLAQMRKHADDYCECMW